MVDSKDFAQVFGNLNTFAIVYRPDEKPVDGWTFAYCHLVLGGHLIGSQEEFCLLSTWSYFIKKVRDHIAKNRGNSFPLFFAGLNDREIFELIRKSNQLEEEFDPDFDYLPAQATNALWAKHCVFLDETIDGYSIVFIERDDKIEFLWKIWDDSCPQNEELNSVLVDYKSFISTVDACLEFLQVTYPELKHW